MQTFGESHLILSVASTREEEQSKEDYKPEEKLSELGWPEMLHQKCKYKCEYNII